jgi:hypothetical protein
MILSNLEERAIMAIDHEKFKLALAADLVCFLMQAIIQDHPDQTFAITSILNTWSESMEKKVNDLRQRMAEELVEKQASKDDEYLTTDVAEIILEIQNLDTKIIKGEFKTNIRTAIFKSMGIDYLKLTK